MSTSSSKRKSKSSISLGRQETFLRDTVTHSVEKFGKLREKSRKTSSMPLDLWGSVKEKTWTHCIWRCMYYIVKFKKRQCVKFTTVLSTGGPETWECGLKIQRACKDFHGSGNMKQPVTSLILVSLQTTQSCTCVFNKNRWTCLMCITCIDSRL